MLLRPPYPTKPQLRGIIALLRITRASGAEIPMGLSPQWPVVGNAYCRRRRCTQIAARVRDVLVMRKLSSNTIDFDGVQPHCSRYQMATTTLRSPVSVSSRRLLYVHSQTLIPILLTRWHIRVNADFNHHSVLPC